MCGGTCVPKGPPGGTNCLSTNSGPGKNSAPFGPTRGPPQLAWALRGGHRALPGKKGPPAAPGRPPGTHMPPAGAPGWALSPACLNTAANQRHRDGAGRLLVGNAVKWQRLPLHVAVSQTQHTHTHRAGPALAVQRLMAEMIASAGDFVAGLYSASSLKHRRPSATERSRCNFGIAQQSAEAQHHCNLCEKPCPAATKTDAIHPSSSPANATPPQPKPPHHSRPPRPAAASPASP